MSFDNDYFSADHNEYTPGRFTKAGRGIMRVVLLFGSAALALGLIIVPILNDQASKMAAQSIVPDGIDRTMTGSIKRSAMAQKIEKHAACIIEVNGRRHGDC
ncbi:MULTISPECIES: hypothetical protein [Brucella]|uniref:hypothetical protein n=1 Tax=Brucella TaxID=234 RepID=UPI0006CAF3E2|nr:MULTISPECIES: hypothetical protein [Brucella]AQQ56184.1 hypothetical protein ADS42_003280 [Brucella melitensis]MBH9727245.1 hypothetical protein [Brucella abortus]MUJ91370.1 hypothetical protein [Brucella abortus]